MTPIDAITRRPLLLTDDHFIYEVYAGTRLDELGSLPWLPAQKDAFVRMQFELRQQHYQAAYPEARTEIILCDGTPAGTLITWETPDTIFLVDIALLAHFRGAGVGSRILREMQEEGKKIVLQVLKENPARRLYSRLGFVTVAEDSMYLSMEWNP